MVVGLIVIAVGMKASGGTSGGLRYSATPLSPAQFARAGERICVSLRRQLQAVVAKKPKNLRQVTQYVHRLTSIFDRLRTGLYGLIPPPVAAVPFRRLLGKLDTADRALHRLDHLTETRQWRRVVLLVRSRWWKNVGKQLGPPTKPGEIRCGGRVSGTIA